MILKFPGPYSKIFQKVISLLLLVFAVASCSKDPIREVSKPPTPSTDTSYRYGIFVVNEGNFTWGNASVTFYDPEDHTAAQDIFRQANGRPLGDVAEMMKVDSDLGFIVVNNSSTLEVVSMDKFKTKATISGFNKPRCIEFIDNYSKAYVTNLVKDISVIDLKSLTISKTIPTPNWTEGMVRYQNFVFFSSIGGYTLPNSKRNPQILVVDINQDKIVDSIKTGKEPLGIVIDWKNKIWVLCTGGYDNYENASLIRIDPDLRAVEKTFIFPSSSTTPSRLCINGTGDTIYFLKDGVYEMPVSAQDIPSQAFIPSNGRSFYGLGIHPVSGNIFVSDAVDFTQDGKVYQYHQKTGVLMRSFTAGRIPGSFCFSPKPSSK